jgi:hypothetical protein
MVIKTKTKMKMKMKMRKPKVEPVVEKKRKRKVPIEILKRKKGIKYDLSGMEDPTKSVKKLPKEGVWLPISIAALLCGFSAQMVRFLYMNKIIAAIKFESGPTLVNFSDIEKNWKNVDIKNC